MEHTPTTRKSLISIITAASAGTLIEWYDFFLFGSLATIISTEFFPKENPVAAFLATLATFSAGLLVRPLGAVIFGRLGDTVGRKSTFSITLIIMGVCTVGMGLVPGYESIGYLAPLLVLLLRLMQGLALGGEYGGATTYVAEHVKDTERGFWTSWIQSTSGLAFILSVVVILSIKSFMTPRDWADWGWRIPFLASVFLFAISIFIRRRMAESPLFTQAKQEGKTSKNPLKESFGNRANLKMILLAFFGLTIGAGVIGWIGFYALSYLSRTLSVDFDQANSVIVIGILCGVPFFYLFGWMSDKVGRKWLMMIGMLAGLLGFRPIFNQIHQVADVTEKTTLKTEVIGSERGLSAQKIYYTDGTILEQTRKGTALSKTVTVGSKGKWQLIFMIFLLQLIYTVAAGPMAAYMVEMFPLKIRYTSLSIPYHFGSGVFGGLAPYLATYFVDKAALAKVEDYYLAGLNYPLLLTFISLIIGSIYLQESAFARTFRFIPARLLNAFRKWLGLIWILLSGFTAWFGLFQLAMPKLFSGVQEDIVFGLIIGLIITPVVVLGLFLFGKYAWQGEYAYIPPSD